MKEAVSRENFPHCNSGAGTGEIIKAQFGFGLSEMASLLLGRVRAG